MVNKDYQFCFRACAWFGWHCV